MMRLVDLIFLKISASKAKLFSLIYASVLELSFVLHFICTLTIQSDGNARAYNGGSLVFGAIMELVIMSALLVGAVIGILKDKRRLFLASITLFSVLFFVGRFLGVANDPYSISGVGWAVAYWVFKLLFYSILLAYFVLTALAFVFDFRTFRLARAILLTSLVIGLVYYIMAIIAGASTIKNNGFALWDLFVEPLLIVGGVLFFPSALFAMDVDKVFDDAFDSVKDEPVDEPVDEPAPEEAVDADVEETPAKKPAAKKPAAKK